jgi:hypothetical protein
MHRTWILAITVVALGLSACKSGNLATSAASAALGSTVFAPSNAIQTLSFTSGDPAIPKADALQGYLYAKHWLDCKDTQPGVFSHVAVCTLNAAGRTFAHENDWTSAHPDGSCAQCEVWTVPLARAELRGVTALSAIDKTHAVADYDYEVVPGAFGGELGDWMRTNPVAWCGPDPRAIGAWSQPRAGKAAFVRTGTRWEPAPAPGGFTATFGAPAAERLCA